MRDELGDREGRPYMSCRHIGLGYVGATLAVARHKWLNVLFWPLVKNGV